VPFPASPSPSLLAKNPPEEILPREDGTRVRVKLQIWDTAGEERFRSVAPMYYKNASAIILVYDSTNRTSFKALESWVQEIDDNATEDLLIVSITASKCD
jgi:small GTP-binding protein